MTGEKAKFQVDGGAGEDAGVEGAGLRALVGGVVWVIDVGGGADDSGMRDLHALRSDPLLPHHVTLGDEVRADCGHPTSRTCDGCTACADCEGCYCGEAEDEPTHLLAS